MISVTVCNPLQIRSGHVGAAKNEAAHALK